MLTPSLAARMDVILPSPTLAITAKAKRMQGEGLDVVSFGAGEPDFCTPEPIVEAAVQALHNGETRYAPSAGTPKLRQAVSEKFAGENGLAYSPEQIIVSCGAKHSIYNALQVTINPGDEVILIAPYWMTYAEQVKLAGGIPRVIYTDATTGFSPSFDQLREAVGPKTKAIILNSPSNPTGAVLSREVLKNIASLALRHSFWIITDEIYERLLYGESHLSIASLGKDVYEQTITVAGCSKTYAMTGWRIGFAAAPLAVAKAMSNLQDQVTSNATSFAQAGAVAALHMSDDSIEAMRAEFEVRRDLIVGLLNEIPGVKCPLPGGAFYAFPDITAVLKPGETDIDFTNELLEKAHVAVIPGTVFEGPGHIRLSYATSQSEIRRGVERLSQFIQSRNA